MCEPYLRCFSSGMKNIIRHGRQTENNNSNLQKKTGRSVIEKRGRCSVLSFVVSQDISAALVFCFGTLFVIPACSLCSALKLVVRITFLFFFFFFPDSLSAIAVVQHRHRDSLGVPKTTQTPCHTSLPPLFCSTYIFLFLRPVSLVEWEGVLVLAGRFGRGRLSFFFFKFLHNEGGCWQGWDRSRFDRRCRLTGLYRWFV